MTSLVASDSAMYSASTAKLTASDMSLALGCFSVPLTCRMTSPFVALAQNQQTTQFRMSMQKNEKSVTLKPFKPDEYLIWKIQDEATFRIHGLLDIVKGTEKHPSASGSDPGAHCLSIGLCLVSSKSIPACCE